MTEHDESEMIPCQLCGELILPARAVYLYWYAGKYHKTEPEPYEGFVLDPPMKMPFGKVCARNALSEG